MHTRSNIQERKNSMQWYNKAIQKCLTFEDIIKEDIKNIKKIGQKFVTIHIEY